MTPDELADLEEGLNGLDGDGEDLDKDDDVHEFQRYDALAKRYREMAHELRLPLMDLRRQLSGPPELHWPDALTAGGQVVSQTQGVVDEIEYNAALCERMAWDSYHDYLLRELKSL